MAGICLTLGKRREIERLYNDDVRPSEIAAAVGVTTATIYRELDLVYGSRRDGRQSLRMGQDRNGVLQA